MADEEEKTEEPTGKRIDEARNAIGQVDIAGEGSAAAILVLPTDGERAVAVGAARLWGERLASLPPLASH